MVAYNLQRAVDTTNHLIVAQDVINIGTDKSAMAQATKAALRSILSTSLRRGYFKREEILACEQASVAVTLRMPQTSGAKSAAALGSLILSIFGQDDVYCCPAGEKLSHHFTADQMVRKCDLKRAAYAPSTINTQHLTSAASDTGNTNMSSKPPRRGSTRTRSHACAPGNRRASVRHTEDADGSNALSNEAIVQCRNRDGAERTQLQSHACAE
ncbi:hypothetical protein BSZ22_02030 [Bradyrhizobium canariense]|nr:hypothetical protein BSZ22_02030 [Bradyrhizobium canariense]OSI82330.1 hypothetical protein BSZ23_02035 [Bradyrhizobium canariense]